MVRPSSMWAQVEGDSVVSTTAPATARVEMVVAAMALTIILITTAAMMSTTNKKSNV